eukprot:Gb_11065 [translate_table: standard]
MATTESACKLMKQAMLLLYVVMFLLPNAVQGETRLYKFNIQQKNVTRICHTKSIVTVNGQFPGPTIYAREGDTVLIKVTNNVKYNISIHWHGIRQLRTDTFVLPVEHGKNYLLRIINAALNDELFFDVAHHHLKVVEVDAVYTKPFETKAIVIAPGQTTNVLLHANKKSGRYFMAARPYMDAPIAVDNKTATAILQYVGSSNSSNPILMPRIPPQNDTSFATNFSDALRSLNSANFPAKVPQSVDRHLFFTVGLALNPCPTCTSGSRASASVNNITFVMPTVSLLQAHYFNISGVFTTDFPDNPPIPFNYTGNTTALNLQSSRGTRLSRIQFNSTVQLVLQDTSMLTVENHPIHLHGFNFFIVGRGFGNYNPKKDPAKFNLVDPPERNTVGVPTGGWTAIRFRADNPGVWFMHCHLEVHTTWGLKMAFLVENGDGPNQSILPPPKDLPTC